MGVALLEAGVSAGVVTSEQLAGITDAITSNVNVLLPVGITVLGIMVGIKIIPRIIHTFL